MIFWRQKTNLVMLSPPCALKRNMNPNAQKRLNCKSNESFLKTDTKHLVESAWFVDLLVCCFYDQVHCQAIFDAMLAEAVAIF